MDTCKSPSYSHFTPSAALVPIARVPNLDSRMATLFHHIKLWMQRSIAEVEDRVENKISKHIERKIMAVHQHLDAFELRVLARPTLSIDLSTLQAS